MVVGEPVTFVRWYSGEPNGDDQVNCVEVAFDLDFQWFDGNCAVKEGYVCRRPR